MTSIGASAQPDYLVESLLYPNAKIKEGFHSSNISTKDDQELSGIVVKETDKEVVIRNAANQEVSIAKANITQRVNGGSLMPSGLVDALLPEERLDLIKFLSSLGKPGEYDAAKGGVARLWRFYHATSQNAHLGMEGVVSGDFKRGEWTPIFTLVNGELSRDICEVSMPSRGGSRGLFAATQFQSANGGMAKFSLVGGAKEVWLNGVPIKAGAEFSAQLKSGVNTLVLQLDGANLPDAVKLGSGDVTFLTN
jgi:putative heme-binding domain-containing protein